MKKKLENAFVCGVMCCLYFVVSFALISIPFILARAVFDIDIPEYIIPLAVFGGIVAACEITTKKADYVCTRAQCAFSMGVVFIISEIVFWIEETLRPTGEVFDFDFLLVSALAFAYGLILYFTSKIKE